MPPASSAAATKTRVNGSRFAPLSPVARRAFPMTPLPTALPGVATTARNGTAAPRLTTSVTAESSMSPAGGSAGPGERRYRFFELGERHERFDSDREKQARVPVPLGGGVGAIGPR